MSTLPGWSAGFGLSLLAQSAKKASLASFSRTGGVTGRGRCPDRSSLIPRRSSGYILLELVIALTIFSIAVLGLARTLGTSIEVANILNRDNLLRIGMRSFLEEVRRKPLAELSMTFVDTSTGITYTSSAEPVTLTRSDGNLLSDLYDLKVLASYTVGAELREETVSVYVHKPAQR